jgi:hypothetical protein
MGETEAEVSDEALERMRRDRFRQRVGRVLEAMQREGVDFRGVAAITPDGRIAVRVVPVEAPALRGQGDGEAGQQ